MGQSRESRESQSRRVPGPTEPEPREPVADRASALGGLSRGPESQSRLVGAVSRMPLVGGPTPLFFCSGQGDDPGSIHVQLSSLLKALAAAGTASISGGARYRRQIASHKLHDR